MTDILERLRNFDGTRTHWEGCESSHTICAAHAEIVKLRAEVATLKSVVNTRTSMPIPAIPPETPGGNGLPSEATGRK